MDFVGVVRDVPEVGELTWRQAAVLQMAILGAQRGAPPTVTGMHIAVRKCKSSMSRATSRLTDRGLVSLAIDPDDHRRVYVHPTAQGRSLMVRMEEAAAITTKEPNSVAH